MTMRLFATTVRILPDVALTVRQPFAWAIAEGLKPLEIRPRPPPRKHVGMRIAIHAGRFIPLLADWNRVGQVIAGVAAPRVMAMPDRFDMVRGAIIATATLSGFVDAAGAKTLPRDAYRWWSPTFGLYGWLLDDVVALREPIPARGQLGLWKLGKLRPNVIAAQVLDAPLRQLAALRGVMR